MTDEMLIEYCDRRMKEAGTENMIQGFYHKLKEQLKNKCSPQHSNQITSGE